MRQPWFAFLLLLFLAGCSQPAAQPAAKPALNRARFDAVYRAGKAIEAAMPIGVDYSHMGELIQRFATELSIAADQADTEQEKEVIAAYEDGLSAYRDSMTVWGWQLGQRLAPYRDERIPTLMKEYSVPPNATTGNSDLAVQTIWQTAIERVARANQMLDNP
jgi:hypothetical protein